MTGLGPELVLEQRLLPICKNLYNVNFLQELSKPPLSLRKKLQRSDFDQKDREDEEWGKRVLGKGENEFISLSLQDFVLR